MSALNELVRKLKKAVTGEEGEPSDTKPFNWEPAQVESVPVPTKEAVAREPLPEAEGGPLSWRRAAAEAAAVVGASIPADVANFATVYKGASVQEPAHGYGVERVAQMLEHRSLAGLDKGVKASAVLAALDAAGVPVHDVIHDGLLRYKALVAFEAAKDLELHQVRPRSEQRRHELKAAVESFQKKKHSEIEALTRESAAAAASLARLKARQRAEEERFQRAISLFVEPLPARVIAMPPKPFEALPSPEAKLELKLVAGQPPAAATPAQPQPEAKGSAERPPETKPDEEKPDEEKS